MFHHPMMMITTEEKTMKENSSCNLICGTKLFICILVSKLDRVSRKASSFSDMLSLMYFLLNGAIKIAGYQFLT